MSEFSEEQEQDLGWSRLDYTDRLRIEQCTLHKPLLIVIPPEGVTIPCPVHPEGHFFGKLRGLV